MDEIFVGDNDHGDCLPSQEVLMKEIKQLREDLEYAKKYPYTFQIRNAMDDTINCSMRYTKEFIVDVSEEAVHMIAQEIADLLVKYQIREMSEREEYRGKNI